MENKQVNAEIFPFSSKETMLAMELMYFLAIGEFGSKDISSQDIKNQEVKCAEALEKTIKFIVSQREKSKENV